ncbi:MAG: ABC transporter permease [Ignavibacteria bacterium]|nr:ABC transporter permease [Ignavibacteria bacterium]
MSTRQDRGYRSLLLSELLKTFRKWRTYIGFIAIAVLVPVVQVGLKLEGGSIVNSVTRSLSGDFFFVGNLFNGYFVTHLIMNSLWVHIPFLISLVAGDELAGEATAGTFRLILTRPVSRSRILMTKYAATLLYTAALVIFLGALSTMLGVALFGAGDLIVVKDGLTVIPEGDVLPRLGIAFGLAVWSMWCVASLAFLLSSLVENPIGPIIGTMTIIIVFFVIGNIPVELFASIKPYLFTSYLTVWQEALRVPIDWQGVLQTCLRLLAFSIGFYLITWYIFTHKDILS